MSQNPIIHFITEERFINLIIAIFGDKMHTFNLNFNLQLLVKVM